MAIKIGNTEITEIGKIKIANTDVKEVWVGNTKVWPAGGNFVLISCITSTRRIGDVQVFQNGTQLQRVSRASENCQVSTEQKDINYGTGTVTVSVIGSSGINGNGSDSNFYVRILRDDDVEVAYQVFTATGNSPISGSLDFIPVTGREYRIIGTFIEDVCQTPT